MSNFEDEFAEFAKRFGYEKKSEFMNPYYLRGLNFQVVSVIDAGVRQGTPSLYHAFPDANFYLVDPQRGGDTILAHKPSRYTFINVALGEESGTAMLTDDRAKSTIANRSALTGGASTERYKVAVASLDELIESHKIRGPIGIKLDIEGYELNALKGLNRHLPNIEFMICEVSVRKRFENGYTFSEFCAAMLAKGFEFYNVLNALQRRPYFYDVLYVRKNSALLE